MANTNPELVNDGFSQKDVKQNFRESLTPVKNLDYAMSNSDENRTDVDTGKKDAVKVDEDDIEESKRLIIEQIKIEGLIDVYVQDIDPEQENTFCILRKRMGEYQMHRFSSNQSLYFLDPSNCLRKAAITITTSQYPL
ncbi:hypothetical protein TrispH2_009908 [Trichoplax sp. H2]|nr:hypothetical protein TrispH2_009908 [Trichoplax sp. H2]|eukprot:RDD37666.1 hypothetical protein TrispH2_009908 [Trichoplax sp. H2]